MQVNLHALFKGKVQGVGFRWTVLDHAEHFQLTGTVENLPDGSVEVFARGLRPTLEAFLEAVQREAGSAHIQHVEATYSSETHSYSKFIIL